MTEPEYWVSPDGMYYEDAKGDLFRACDGTCNVCPAHCWQHLPMMSVAGQLVMADASQPAGTTTTTTGEGEGE